MLARRVFHEQCIESGPGAQCRSFTPESGQAPTSFLHCPSSKQRLFGSARSGIARSLRIASDLNIGENALREWVQRAKIDSGDGPAGALTTDEREEFMRLRREHKRVLMDLEILKKAAEFFARRNL